MCINKKQKKIRVQFQDILFTSTSAFKKPPSKDRSVEEPHAQSRKSAQNDRKVEQIQRRRQRKKDFSTDRLQQNRCKGGVRGLRGSGDPRCEIKEKQEIESGLIDASRLLFARETVERQSALSGSIITVF